MAAQPISGYVAVHTLRIAKFNCALHHSLMVMPELVILIVDESADRALLIEQALREAGHRSVKTIYQLKGVAREIELQAPDVIVMDLGNPERSRGGRVGLCGVRRHC